MGHKPPKANDHPVDVHIGERIRTFRKIRNLSTREVADPLGLSYQQVQKYEAGTNRMSASTLFEITNLLGVPVSSVFEGLPHIARTPPTAPQGPIAELLGMPDGQALAEAMIDLAPPVRARLLTFLQALQRSPET